MEDDMKYVLNSSGHELKFPNILKAENCILIDSDGKRYLNLQ